MLKHYFCYITFMLYYITYIVPQIELNIETHFIVYKISPQESPPDKSFTPSDFL